MWLIIGFKSRILRVVNLINCPYSRNFLLKIIHVQRIKFNSSDLSWNIFLILNFLMEKLQLFLTHLPMNQNKKKIMKKFWSWLQVSGKKKKQESCKFSLPMEARKNTWKQLVLLEAMLRLKMKLSFSFMEIPMMLCFLIKVFRKLLRRSGFSMSL